MKRQAHARIDWQDESTWTLDALSNWTAQRELLSKSAQDAAKLLVRLDYSERYLDFTEDAPDWALQVTSRVLMCVRIQRKFAKDNMLKWDEEGIIRTIKEVYGDNNG